MELISLDNDLNNLVIFIIYKILIFNRYFTLVIIKKVKVNPPKIENQNLGEIFKRNFDFFGIIN